MKTILFLFAVFIFGLVSCNNATSDSVEINGVRWAKSNVETPGTFARNPESAGGFFTWEEAQNVCPRGWRLPTRAKFESLRNAAGGGWTAVNGVNGRIFGIAPNEIFLPAAGGRCYTDDAFDAAGIWGFFWSGSQHGTTRSWRLLFNSGGIYDDTGSYALGLSVRCVVK